MKIRKDRRELALFTAKRSIEANPAGDRMPTQDQHTSCTRAAHFHTVVLFVPAYTHCACMRSARGRKRIASTGGKRACGSSLFTDTRQNGPIRGGGCCSSIGSCKKKKRRDTRGAPKLKVYTDFLLSTKHLLIYADLMMHNYVPKSRVLFVTR